MGMQSNDTAGIRALYTEEAILEAAGQIIAKRILKGDNYVFDNFDKRISAIMQGQTLTQKEGGAGKGFVPDTKLDALADLFLANQETIRGQT